MTVKHEYEFVIFGGCAKLAGRLLGGSEIGFGFTALIDANGNVIYFQSNELKEGIREDLKKNFGVIFFDPFDAPEYTFISWDRCSKQMLEKSLDISLDSAGLNFTDSHGVMY